MEKVLAFFSPSFFSPSLFISSFFLGGGVTYKPTLNPLEAPKFLAFFESFFFGVES
ncbi:hypothetical protein E5K61_03590 [Helicobacter pylori]|nr:hypothetical protein E5K61_03590 [Helicobacter pylori]